MMKLTVTKLLTVALFLVILAAASCGGGGGGLPPGAPGQEGFAPLPPSGAPPGGDPEESTQYFRGAFTLPGGASFGDMRGVATSTRYIYVADVDALYAFDLQGNLVNVVTGGFTGWERIQGVAVIPRDPFPGDGDATRYPFPEYPVVAVNPFDFATWGGCAVIYAPNLDEVVTIEDAENPYAALKFYPIPRIEDFLDYGLWPCTPCNPPPPPDPMLLLVYTYDISVTREGAIVMIVDIDIPGTPPYPDYPQAMLFFDPHTDYLISPRVGGTISVEVGDEGQMRTFDRPFRWKEWGDAVGWLGHLAFANTYPQNRTETQRLFVNDFLMEADYIGFSSLTVDMTLPPFTYTVAALLDTPYGYSRIIGLPAGALPGSFSWGPPFAPGGGLEDPDLDQGGPSGLGVDPRTDYLYACDPGNRRVQVFDTDGFYVRQIGDGLRGTAGNRLVAPSRVTIGLDGTVFVCDTLGDGSQTGLLRVFPSAPSAPEFGSVGGFVFNAGLNPPGPMVGATVSISGAIGTVASAETNINGEYRFENLPLGIYHLVALKTNYSTDHTDVDLVRDETVQVNFNLYPRQGHVNGGYVGYLYNEVTRLPVGGATVRILPTSMEAMSDVYGKYSFDDILAGDYQVEISANGYATLTKDVHIVAGQTTVDHTIFMTPI